MKVFVTKIEANTIFIQISCWNTKAEMSVAWTEHDSCVSRNSTDWEKFSFRFLRYSYSNLKFSREEQNAVGMGSDGPLQKKKDHVYRIDSGN